MTDAFRLWYKHFTSRSLVSQNNMHVTSDEKFVPKTLLKLVPKSGLYHKERTFFTSLNFYRESYLSNIS